MGSMTGAPKIEALEQIEQHEDFKRGLYSGSIGLIEPNGDFDLNVVIRSLLYNRKNQYLSCSVGSALTIEANPEAEYQECLLKAEKLIHGLR
jgi:para-aminobenzoate synthetase component 1